jgi:type IV secretory pathway VirB4 component
MSLVRAQRPAHRVTTRHAQALYPFIATGGLGGRGTFIGRDGSGGAFCFDPWVLYDAGILDDPNVIVLGKLGQGKSALVKTLLWRMLLFGRRAFVLDVKREYGPLCEAVGVKPITLAPGGGVRLNPLATHPEEHGQTELLRAVTATVIGESLSQIEAASLREALRTVRERAGEPTLPQIAAVMFTPPAEMAQRLNTDPVTLALDVRRAALALQDLCEGPLRGIFDGPTTPGLDLDAQLLVLDLHAVRDSSAVGILMACATAWMGTLLSGAAERPGRERLMSVADESWKIVQHTGLGEWFQSNFKLARQFGVMNLVVLHKLGDLQAAGDAGSRAARIAEGLIADASTRVIFHQDSSQIETTRALLGLSKTEARLLTQLSSGQALWRVGSRSFVVQHHRSRLETRLTNTDSGMRLAAGSRGSGVAGVAP